MGFLFYPKIMQTKLSKKKARLKKKLKVSDDTPGALIAKANTLPKPGTQQGLAARGLI